MAGTKMRKKKPTKKNVHKKNVQGKNNKVTGSNTDNQKTEVAVYDALFAKQQVARHFGTCVVCHKQDYFLKSCSRCKEAKCCLKCLGEHRIKDDQRLICVRNLLFANARECIPLDVKENYFNNGFAEISSHLYSVPKREVFNLMGHSRSVVMVQVLEFNIVPEDKSDLLTINIVQLKVQDNDGLQAAIYIHPNGFEMFLFQGSWLSELQAQLPPGKFILLTGIFWNHRINGASIDVVDHEQQMLFVPQIAKIGKLITSKDCEVLNRVNYRLSRRQMT